MKYVMVIDESQTIRITCRIHLEKAGYSVVAFPTSQEAFKQLPVLDPPPDVLLLGLRDASPDHQRLVKHLQEHPRYAQGRLVLLWRREELRSLPRWLAGCEFLPTPFLVQDLLKIVEHPFIASTSEAQS